MKSSVLLALLSVVAQVVPGYLCPHGPHRPVIPQVKGTPRVLGLVGDSLYNRDSCGSSDFGDRTFWTCRDTQLVNSNGQIDPSPVISSTASYSDQNSDGTPNFKWAPRGANLLASTVLQQYGNNSVEQAFFPVQSDECRPPSGSCGNRTRYALWPYQPPMVAERYGNGSLVAYTWIQKSMIQQLKLLNPNAATTLYRTNYDPSLGDALPKVTVVNEEFYAEGEIPFGRYGNVVRNGYSYLYGQANGVVSLARVPCGSVENKGDYEYYVDGAWTKAKPTIGREGISIPNASTGGQGTYYFSERWQSYVWIGGNGPGANFYITTAPAPEGPWIQPFKFYSGVEGNCPLGAYSVQAHPAMSNSWESNGIYVTYTKNDFGPGNKRKNPKVRTTPMVYVEWAW